MLIEVNIKKQIKANKLKAMKPIFLYLFSYLMAILSNTAYCQKIDKGMLLDTAVWKIKLADYKSTVRVLGDSAWKFCFEENNSLPRIELVNKHKMQILRLYFHYGGVKNAVDGFEIMKIDSSYLLPVHAVAVKDTGAFITSKNIAIGLTKAQVENTLGSKYRQAKKRGNSVEYIYTNKDANSEFLKRYNELRYFIKCIFINDILTSYRFGFEYI